MTSAESEPRAWWHAYDPGVPTRVDVPDAPLPALLAASAARVPERTAIRFFGRSIAYRELDEAVNRFANALLGLGVRSGDRVALFLPHCPKLVVALLRA